MHGRTHRLSLLLAAIAPLALSLVAPVFAQAPERERRFVYGLNLFNGTEYSTGFVPPAVDTIYLLAGHDGVLDPKLTEVYFWPITNEYRPDFTALSELVPGRLEVARGGQVVETLDLTDYVVQFDPAAGLGTGRVFLGAAARERWGYFQAERVAYVERLRSHADALAEYSRQLEERRGRAAFDAEAAAPEPPAEPAPFSLYSTEVGRGFALRLPVGEYTIRVRDAAGGVVPDSEKRLDVVAPRRAGVGYSVVPQERWTLPIEANDPAGVVYVAPGGVAYLRPFAEQELNALAYARLRNPQDFSAGAHRWQWVHVAPLREVALVLRDGERERRLEIEEFAVEQVPGAGLGYRVVPLDARADGGPRRAADLTAFRVEAPPDRRAMQMHLVDADGRERPGSSREVVALSTVPGWQLALPTLVPLAFGLSVWLWRRDQVHAARSLPPEQRRRLA